MVARRQIRVQWLRLPRKTRQAESPTLPARWEAAACNRSHAVCRHEFQAARGRLPRLRISAPIWRRGSITRRIGRRRSELSPVIVEVKACPASTPESMRIVEPEFSASIVRRGAFRPSNPFPTMRTRSRLASISRPSRRKHSSVLAQSAAEE